MAFQSINEHRLEDRSSPLIELIRAAKVYGGRPVLREVSLSVESGTALALIGRNGSGKSTLLSILAGLTRLTSGTIQRSKGKLSIGYAPEAFPGLKFSAEQYLRSMGRISGMPEAGLEDRITALLEAFHLEEFRTYPMTSFSKGMLQKVNLIQSLLSKPELLLLDEPMSGLDLPAQHTLIELLQELKQGGTAMVFSVHEPLCVETLADGVHVLQAGQTVMKVSETASLQDKPSTYIMCTAIAPQQKSALAEMPGLISIEAVRDEFGMECSGLTVEREWTDQCLRYVLDAGGSVISVERRRGLSGLMQWMDPKTVQEEQTL